MRKNLFQNDQPLGSIPVPSEYKANSLLTELGTLGKALYNSQCLSFSLVVPAIYSSAGVDRFTLMWFLETYDFMFIHNISLVYSFSLFYYPTVTFVR